MNRTLMVLLGVIAAIGVAAALVLLQSAPEETLDVPGPGVSEQAPAPPPPRDGDWTPLPVPPAGSSGEERSEPEVTVPASRGRAVVSGRVLDDGGKPVAGVSVVLVIPWPGSGALPRPGDAFSFLRRTPGKTGWPACPSAPDGSFELSSKVSGRHLLVAGPPDFQEAWLEVDLSFDTPVSGVDITLYCGLSVSGRLLETGKEVGIPGISVQGDQVSMDRTGFGGNRNRECRTGPSGEFELSGFEPGPVNLTVLVPKERYFEVEGGAHHLAAAGETVTVRAVGVGLVEFRGLEEETGSAIDIPLQVRLSGEERHRFRPLVWKNGPGDFVLRGYGIEQEYILSGVGYCPIRVRFDVQNGVRTVREEAVRMSRGVILKGKVTFEEGAQSGRAFLYCRPLDGEDRPFRTLPVPMDGAYILQGLKPMRYRVWVLRPGFRVSRVDLVLAGRQTVQDFHLTRRAPGDPPAPADAPYAERRHVEVSLNAEDVGLEELVDWLRELTGADLKLGKGLGLSEDEAMVQLAVDDIPLSEALRLVTLLKGLSLDEETGEIKRGE